MTFRRLILIPIFTLIFIPTIYGASPSPEEIACIGQKIYLNECSGKKEHLTVWNKGEEFPSFGVGHFIWYPEGKKGPFKESFPELLDFLNKNHVALPDWLEEVAPKHSPWKSREEFYRDINSPRMTEFRDFLEATIPYQVDFIINRFKKVFREIIKKAPSAKKEEVELKFQVLTETRGGWYPLVDYVNFKGEGIYETEQYQGEGWGLLQVLIEMKDAPAGEEALVSFRDAAVKVLTKRVQNAPEGRGEARWLLGWKNRLNTYLASDCISQS